MSTSYQQYLLTRFNVPMGGIKTRQLDSIDVSRDMEYLSKRFSLFEKYTVPSVVGQTCSDFVWLVLLSANTPDMFKQRMEEICHRCPVCRPVYVADDEDWHEIVSDIFGERPAGVVVTFRVDNDDAIALDFIQRVRERIDERISENYAVLFENGIQYRGAGGGVSTRYHFPTNHFGTVVERADGPVLTALGYNHMQIGENIRLVSVDNAEPMWLEVVHETNVSNRMHFRYEDVLFDADFKQLFGVEVPETNQNRLLLRAQAVLNGPANALRLLHQYGPKKILQKLKGRMRRAPSA